jgi:hypothetical protein
MYRIIQSLVLAILVGSVVSCASDNVQRMVLDGVAHFRLQNASHDYHAIYVDADPQLRDAVREPEFVDFLSSNNVHLGGVKRTKLRKQQIGWFIGKGKVVTLLYDTQFERGSAIEQFDWHVAHGHAYLFGYHLNEIKDSAP